MEFGRCETGTDALCARAATLIFLFRATRSRMRIPWPCLFRAGRDVCWGFLRKRITSAIVFSLATAIGLSLAGQLWVSSENADRRRFSQLADDAVGRVDARLASYVSLLYATRAFLAVDGPGISAEKFEHFISGLDLAERHDGIQGIGFAATIPAAAATSVADELSARYSRPVEIWPTTTDQPLRTPIVLLEPQDPRNRVAIGYDMYSDPMRREAMDAAARSGRPTASGAVRLVQEIDENRQFGFLIYLPVAAGEASRVSAISPSEGPGFVYAPLRTGDFLEAALFQMPQPALHVEAFDGEAKPERRIFSSREPLLPEIAHFAVERRLDVAGRTWLFRLSPTANFERLGSNYPAALLATFVLGLAIVLALLSLVQSRRLEAVAAPNEASQRNLAQKDMLLREMNHRIKNSIARMLSIARQTARRAESLEDFTTRYSARLQAMAAAQEMLTRSRWGRAEIGALLSAELAQVFGEDEESCRLEGPEVEVDETVSQALGLTFHELATNAMKYGALSSPEGTLVVEWRLDGQDLVIDWHEQGGQAPDLSAARAGFGTKLIDMTIRGELGGSSERRAGEGLFAILIRFPFAGRGTSQPVPGARL